MTREDLKSLGCASVFLDFNFSLIVQCFICQTLDISMLGHRRRILGSLQNKDAATVSTLLIYPV